MGEGSISKSVFFGGAAMVLLVAIAVCKVVGSTTPQERAVRREQAIFQQHKEGLSLLAAETLCVMKNGDLRKFVARKNEKIVLKSDRQLVMDQDMFCHQLDYAIAPDSGGALGRERKELEKLIAQGKWKLDPRK